MHPVGEHEREPPERRGAEQAPAVGEPARARRVSTMRACIRRIQGAGARDARLEDAAEMLGVVRVHQHSRARQMKVVEPRQPEAQRRGAQHRRPGLALERRERAHRVIGGEQRPGATLRPAQSSRSPGTSRSRRPRRRRAGSRRRRNRSRSRRRCARPRTARCRGRDPRAPGRAAGRESAARPGKSSSFSSSWLARSVEKAVHLLRGEAPPLRAARILQVGAVRAAGEVHAREQRAELGAMRRAGCFDRALRAAASRARRACRSGCRGTGRTGRRSAPGTGCRGARGAPSDRDRTAALRAGRRSNSVRT